MNQDNDIVTLLSGNLKKEKEMKITTVESQQVIDQQLLTESLLQQEERIQNLERQVELLLSIVLKDAETTASTSRQAKTRQLPLPSTYISYKPPMKEDSSDYENNSQSFNSQDGDYDSDLYESHTELMDK